MTIKLKLLGGGTTISLLLIVVLVIGVYTFGNLNRGFSDVVEKSATGVRNSQSTEQSIVAADQSLTRISNGMLAVVDDIHHTNMQVKVLERKLKSLSATLVQLTEAAGSTAENLPEGDALYAVEDITDAASDIEETMRREALVSLSRTVAKMDEFTRNIGVEVDSIKQLTQELGKVRELGTGVVSANREIRALAEDFSGDIGLSRNVIVGVLLVTVILAMAGALLLTRTIIRPLNRANAIARGIAQGDLNQTVDILGDDEIGQLGKSMSEMIKNLEADIKETRHRAHEAMRIRMALDVCSTNVIVAGSDHRIIYQNRSSGDTLGRIHEELQRDLAQLDVEGFVGADINVFHPQPEAQGKVLAELSETHREDFVAGGRHLRLIATPVFSDSHERLGTAMEWTDRTDEVAVEAEVEAIVAAAQEGDLSQRIGTEDKYGFFQHLALGVNAMIDQVARIFDELSEVMGAMAKGDLTQPLRGDYRGSFETLKDDVNGTLGNLRKVIGELRASMDELRTTTNDISSGNNNLSMRTEQQAANLEKTAATMEELTSTVRHNAENATQANQLAGDARQQAEQGGTVVNRAVEAMEVINAASNKIAEIIGVVDDIAFQTNLLALNASVEAARAGEQGRGFAVVATEVRNLAGRSAAAAREIKGLIQDSVVKVKAGAELVNESGKTLVEIVNGVNKVGNIIAEIAAASAEQSAGIDQVNHAITAMDEVTQQNAALAEQTSAASASMSEKTVELNGMVSRFLV